MIYESLKDVILNSSYQLTEILDKIYVMYNKSKLSQEEMEELEELAREYAKTDDSIDTINKIKEMDLRLKKCEEEIAKLKDETGSETTEEYPEFIDGEWYYRNDKVSENGKKYICIAPEGQVCVWPPSKYPAYWKEII